MKYFVKTAVAVNTTPRILKHMLVRTVQRGKGDSISNLARAIVDLKIVGAYNKQTGKISKGPITPPGALSQFMQVVKQIIPKTNKLKRKAMNLAKSNKKVKDLEKQLRINKRKRKDVGKISVHSKDGTKPFFEITPEELIPVSTKD